MTLLAHAHDLRALFDGRCAASASAVAYAEVLGDTVGPRLSYADLHRQVGACVAELTQRTRPGDRVGLLMPAGLPWVVAFWACVVSGRVAVPLAEPRADRQDSALDKLHRVLDDADVALLWVEPGSVWLGRAAEGSLGRPCQAMALTDETQLRPWPGGLAAPEPGSLAYLQYTSGSTGQPRGVMLTHANVLAQARSAVPRWHMDADTRMLCWLPLFHDYGLVSGVLLPFAAGGRTDFMSALSFVRQPLNWWRQAARLGSTHTGGPHFAFAATLKALASHPDWTADLSALRSVSCGAEPIHAVTVRAWQAEMARFGLKPSVFAPGYGMAETVLGLTSHDPAVGQRVPCLTVDRQALAEGRVQPRLDGDAGTQTLVSCGRPLADVSLCIVQPETLRLAEPGRVGEVWVRGGTVGQGYWRRPDAQGQTFEAHLVDGAHAPDGARDGGWLRTGDLGFLHDGELYLAGRHKDLLIVHGRNIHPQDLEWSAARAHAACVDGGGVAFSVEEHQGGWPGEQLVLVQEVRPGVSPEQARDIASLIRQAVAEAHELPVQAVVLLRKGRLPRTSSGKVRRRETRAAWLEQRLDDVILADRIVPVGEAAVAQSQAGAVHADDPLAQHVIDIWQAVLGRPVPSLQAHFFELGGHSLTATQAMSRLSVHLGVSLPLALLFAHPTVASLTQAVRGQWTGGDAPALPTLQPVPREGALPLSFSQQRMWLVQQMDPETTAYNVPLAVRLEGPLHLDAWQAALQALCDRHEAFRVRVQMRQGHQGRPMQVLGPRAPLHLDFVDARAWPAAERMARVDACLREGAAHVFDLVQGPLHRPLCIRIDEQTHLFQWVMHHIIVDQWAAVLLWRELAELYNARCQARAPRLQAKRLDQIDHAHWQRSVMQTDALAEQMTYWRHRLEGLSPASLPLDRPWRPGLPLGGALLTRPLPPALREGMQRIAAEHAVTPYMVMLACLQIVIARQTQQDDVIVGTPVANRTRLDTEGVVGTLVNTLPMRTDLSGDPRFVELLGQVRRHTLEAFAHQDLSFDALVEQLGAAHGRGAFPLGIQVLLNVHNSPVGDIALDGLRWSVHTYDRGATQFPLSFSVDTEILHQVGLEYASALFHPDTARRWLDQFLAVLTQAVTDPTQHLSAFTLMTPQDARLLAQWNDTARPLPLPHRVDECVLQGVAQARHPVIVHPASGQSWHAAELTQRVQAWAQALRAQGIQRGHRVGLSMGRGPELLAAILAVWQAGAAYVPLDPAFPQARLQDMVDDAGLSLLLTDRANHAAWRHFPGPVWLVDDGPLQAASGVPVPPLAPDAQRDARPDDPAYLIYTSGSTGRPKGVVVPHQAVVNFLHSMAREPGLASHQRLLAVTTLSFDIAVLELWLPLLQGACVVLAEREQVVDGAALKALLAQHRIDVMQATPSTWRLLIGAGWTGHRDFKALVGGEPLPHDLAQALLLCTGELWNMYGPTETTVWSTCTQVRAHDLSEGLSIGRPIDNTEVWVLDEHGHPCPPNLPGEIVIGGLGVTSGYWQRPDLTADRFIPDPQARMGGRHRYRTGDLGRWRHDGQLEHLGRLDGQVKLRGHRIELGDVESVLARHPDVKQCVAAVHELRPGDARLVAYVLPREAMPTAAVLREFLRAALPEYMLPQAYVAIASVPLLPNGKTNRRALPVPDLGALRQEAPAPAEPPQTDTERVVAAVWSELLGGQPVGRVDNFFELGGHSLLAARAVQDIEQRLGVRVAMRQLVFETLRQVAAHCDHLRHTPRPD